jgi:hypothetical protein
MRRLPLVLVAVALAARGAVAFNPDPRPAPSGIDAVCAENTSIACTPTTAGGDCASGTCVGDPADLASAVAVRGTLTVIADEDVTGWDEGADGGDRAANARLTLLLQYEKDGALRTFAETYRLTSTDCGLDLEPGDPALCVPAGVGWNQPASEAVITDPQFNIVFTVFGAEVAKAIAVDLTGNTTTTAKPYLDIVDRLPAASASHAGADPLASVQQLKVTIRLAP